MKKNHKKVLVLNKDYQPLDIISWRKAMIKLYSEDHVVDVVKYYDDFVVHSAHSEHKVPAVLIVKTKYVKIRQKKHVKINKNFIYLRDDNVCQYCGTKCNSSTISIDHVVPKSKGGPNSWDNMVTSCLDCNTKKGDKSCEEARMTLRKTPEKCSEFQLRKLVLLSRDQVQPEWQEYFVHMV